jgi:hypothetical protein
VAVPVAPEENLAMPIRPLRCLAASALLTAGLGGCYSPSGGAWARTGGAYTYHSTESQPKTVVVMDLRTDEVIFSIDIPAGRQLTMDFLADEGDDPVYSPDLMRYEVFPIRTGNGKLTNAMSVPGPESRRIDISLRPGPEYAPVPPEMPLRTDQLDDRPDWWTPEGGPLPRDRRGAQKYDN